MVTTMVTVVTAMVTVVTRSNQMVTMVTTMVTVVREAVLSFVFGVCARLVWQDCFFGEYRQLYTGDEKSYFWGEMYQVIDPLPLEQ